MKFVYIVHIFSHIFDSIVAGEAISFYIFYTARLATIEGVEWAAFLSSRSGYTLDSEGKHQHKPGNPVLRHTQTSNFYRETCSTDKTIITRKQMIDNLDFKVEVLFTSKIKANARNVEDALQYNFQSLPLGNRLWRSPDMGAKYELPDKKVHSVGIAYSRKIIPLIEEGWIAVQK